MQCPGGRPPFMTIGWRVIDANQVRYGDAFGSCPSCHERVPLAVDADGAYVVAPHETMDGVPNECPGMGQGCPG